MTSRIPEITPERMGIIVKLTVLGIIGFFLASLTINIVQAVQDSCTNLDSKVNDLEKENQKLERQLEELANLEKELQNNVTELGNQNDALNKSINELDEQLESLDESINNLSSFKVSLESLLLSLNKSEEELVEEVQVLESQLQEKTEAVINASLAVQRESDKIDNITASLSQIEAELQLVDGAQDSLKEKNAELIERDAYLGIIFSTEFERDKEEGYSETEYSDLVEELCEYKYSVDEWDTSKAEVFEARPYPGEFSYDQALDLANFVAEKEVFLL
eukprot:snap_masked-scaffold_32-processed-gene-2.30-mRNA-1 protein AED:0.98 eAED:1.00 QI:0/-1/0/1/-1/1/1/0/276